MVYIYFIELSVTFCTLHAYVGRWYGHLMSSCLIMNYKACRKGIGNTHSPTKHIFHLNEVHAGEDKYTSFHTMYMIELELLRLTLLLFHLSKFSLGLSLVRDWTGSKDRLTRGQLTRSQLSWDQLPRDLLLRDQPSPDQLSRDQLYEINSYRSIL